MSRWIRSGAGSTAAAESGAQYAERFSAGLRDLQRQQRIGSRPAQIDRCDGLAGFRSRLRKTKAGINHQGRSDDQHSVCVLQALERTIDTITRNAFSEENDVW